MLEENVNGNKLKELISKLKDVLEKTIGRITELEKNMNENSNSKEWWNRLDIIGCILSSVILVELFFEYYLKSNIPALEYIKEKLSWNLAFGYFISVIWGSFIIRVTIRILKFRIPDPNEKIGKFTLFLGPLEAFAFTTAWAFGKPIFIALWLGVKMAGRWGHEEKSNKKGEINTFLIGNLLNICFSVIAGHIIKQGF